MRVLQAVTLVSPDGAFGGPVRVAENQARALVARGHDVRVLAGERGWAGSVPTALGGAPLLAHRVVRVLPGGFSGLVAPAALRALPGLLRTADVVHVHLGRDLVTLPVALRALRAGVPLVVQPHGMVVTSDHPLARPLDALLTRRVLRGAARVLVLTDAEEAGLRAVAGDGLRLERLGNGVPAAPPSRPPTAEVPEVLFCARLHPRKRPAAFTAAARQLLGEGVRASFVLVGPDEGEAAAVQRDVDAVGDPALLRWEGALAPEATPARIAAADLLVLPSVDEPYPMTVLEALAAGRPVLVTDTCGLAPAVAETGAGVVVDASQTALVDALRRALGDPGWRGRAGEAALGAARTRFGIDAVAARLEALYDAAR